MKKIKVIIIASLIAFISLSSCSEKEKENDLKRDKLKGQVKYIEYYDYSAFEQFGELKKDELQYYSLTKYNKEGNIEFHLHNQEKEMYYYNKEGKLSLIDYYNSDGYLMYRWEGKYDSKGNIIESNSISNENKIVIKRKFIYGKDGVPIEKNFYDQDGIFSGKTKYQHDDISRLIAQTVYDANGQLFVKYTYQYGKEGDKIINNQELPSLDKQTLKYDSKGNLTDMLDPDGSQAYFKYDNNNDRVEFKFVSGITNRETSSTYKYNHDKYLNWTRMEESSTEKSLKSLKERKIIYYGDKDENNYSKWEDKKYKGLMGYRPFTWDRSCAPEPYINNQYFDPKNL